jgi:hypothetical protein
MFAKKAQLSLLSPTARGGDVLEAIAKGALKTFSETVRLKTFSRAGLQQIQIDATYLASALGDILPDRECGEGGGG